MDGWAREMSPIFADARKASERSELKMLAFVHRQFVFDAGMSAFCKVCGARCQSMQPAPYFTHRFECPLREIQERVRELGGWPDREDDDLPWLHQSSLMREGALPPDEMAQLLVGGFDV